MTDPKPHRVALAFLAHPDDAEILCAGTLIRLVNAGWQIHIATVTAGDCGTMTETPWRISATRTDEARRAANTIGAVYHCLGELDGRVVYDKPTIQKAMDLFRSIGPALVFTHPSKDYMVDHEQTSLLARAASFLYAAPNISAYPLPHSGTIPYLYYCDPVEGLDPLGHPVVPTTFVEISAEMEKKCEALACHASQREWLRLHHGMDEYLEAMRRHASWRGEQVGVPAAEAFVQHRGHAYPRDDMLARLLGGSTA